MLLEMFKTADTSYPKQQTESQESHRLENEVIPREYSEYARFRSLQDGSAEDVGLLVAQSHLWEKSGVELDASLMENLVGTAGGGK